MDWSVAYWRDGQVATLDSDTHRWANLPVEGVLWVDVQIGRYRHQLRGMDNYWVSGDQFGMFNDPENADWYPGPQRVSYRLTGDRRHPYERLSKAAPPEAQILRGLMLSDSDAREVGLL